MRLYYYCIIVCYYIIISLLLSLYKLYIIIHYIYIIFFLIIIIIIITYYYCLLFMYSTILMKLREACFFNHYKFTYIVHKNIIQAHTATFPLFSNTPSITIVETLSPWHICIIYQKIYGKIVKNHKKQSKIQ